MLEFHNPDLLVLLLIVLPVAAASLFLAGSRTAAWKMYSIALPSLAAVLALLAASEPVMHYSTSARRIIVALDNSPATVTAPWHEPLWLQRFLKKHLGRDIPITLVSFASHPHIIASNASLEQLTAQNVPLAAAAHAPADIKHLLAFTGSTPCWIFTAGLLNWKLPDHTDSPAAPIAVTVIPPDKTDIGITHLHLGYAPVAAPKQLSGTVPPPLPQLRLTVRSTGPAATMLVEHAGAQNLFQTPLRFVHSGTKMVLLPPLPRRMISRNSTITVTLGSHDLWPGDNNASVVIPAWGLPRVLIITNHHSTPDHKIPDWIAQYRSPAEFPGSLRTLGRFQALVLDDIAVRDLPIGAEKKISDYVRHLGGGLLITGTQNAFGPGGYGLPRGAHGAASLLEQLSPLSSLPPHPKPRHFIFLMDVSGSLGNSTTSGVTRFALAAHALCAATQLLQPNDQITILLFSGSTRKLVDGKAQTVRPLLPQLLAKIVPNGPTRPDSALPALQRLLTKRSSLILVTDGRIPHLNVPAWKKILLRQAVHLAVIAPGHISRATRQLLAQTGSIELPMQHFSQWGHFLRFAVARDIQGKTQEGNMHWTARSLNLQGQTKRWDRVYPKAGITLLARSGQHSLAAIWRRGLGRVAAISFSDNSAAAAVLRGTLLNRVKAPAGEDHFYISAIRRNSRWQLDVQATRNGQFLNQRQLGLTVVTQHGKILTFPLPQIAPGEYRTILPDRVDTFAATVWQRPGRGKQRQPAVVGRISPPRLPNCYFPATGHVQQCPWPGVTAIAGNAPSALRWHPGRRTVLPLAETSWLLAVLTALTAMLLARKYALSSDA